VLYFLIQHILNSTEFIQHIKQQQIKQQQTQQMEFYDLKYSNNLQTMQSNFQANPREYYEAFRLFVEDGAKQDIAGIEAFGIGGFNTTNFTIPISVYAETHNGEVHPASVVPGKPQLEPRGAASTADYSLSIKLKEMNDKQYSLILTANGDSLNRMKAVLGPLYTQLVNPATGSIGGPTACHLWSAIHKKWGTAVDSALSSARAKLDVPLMFASQFEEEVLKREATIAFLARHGAAINRLDLYNLLKSWVKGIKLFDDPIGAYEMVNFSPETRTFDLLKAFLKQVVDSAPESSLQAHGYSGGVQSKESVVTITTTELARLQDIERKYMELKAKSSSKPKGTSKGSADKYCYCHGFNSIHTGIECKFMKVGMTLKLNGQDVIVTNAMLAATNPHAVAGSIGCTKVTSYSA
jgi:hypothetical protein